MKAQVNVRLVGGAGLGVRAGGLDGAADAAPEIRLPTGLAAQQKIVVVGGFGGGIVGSVGRNSLALGGNSGRKRGKKAGVGHRYLVARGKVGFQSLAEGLVVGLPLWTDAIFELVELRVLVNLPPFAADHAVRGAGGPPTASGGIGRGNEDRRSAGFLVGCRGLEAGAAVVGADGLAAGEQGCSYENPP